MPHQIKRIHFDLLGLKARVARYNAQIQDEMKTPFPDRLRMRKLKIAKLKAKDRMAWLSQQMRAAIAVNFPQAMALKYKN
ncbi:MAG: DUF465 domain-containing protein [Rhodobacteraceae bacterium]|nr:DUF465 domain-containing protein [Paracoccaceae bacterium]